MSIYTGYYGGSKNYPKELKLVSISQSTPFAFSSIKREFDLMPGWDLINAVKNGEINNEEYAEIYKRRFKRLLPQNYGEEIYGDCILLCYETPDKFCHRHLVAEWLRENGFECEEWKAK